jgi:DNA adenine methylase
MIRPPVPEPADQDSLPKPRPFLRWAGGKQWLVSTLLDLLPQRWERYFEPFLGAGALFFSLAPPMAHLSDLNPELINAFVQLRDDSKNLMRRLRLLRHNKKTYKAMSSMKPRTGLSRAVRFIYLNRTAWNGLYRVNSQGKFNVPIGRHKYPAICDAPILLSASACLRPALLEVSDFEVAIAGARKGDLVYLDPPYATSDNARANGFTGYNSALFSLRDQTRLASIALALKRKGCFVVVSNTSHPTVDALYSDFNRIDVSRPSRIAGSVEHRRTVAERLYVSFDAPPEQARNDG